jgi:hypothetical protein
MCALPRLCYKCTKASPLEKTLQLMKRPEDPLLWHNPVKKETIARISPDSCKENVIGCKKLFGISGTLVVKRN